MAYPGGAPVTLVGGQSGGKGAGTSGNPLVTTTAGGTTQTYYLAGTASAPLASLAGNATTSPVTIPANNSASYDFEVVMSGTSPSLQLQSLGPDGTTWRDILASPVTTSPSGQGIVVFTGSGGAQLRLRNTTANAITNLTASLAS